jgi:hypothetical protein
MTRGWRFPRNNPSLALAAIAGTIVLAALFGPAIHRGFGGVVWLAMIIGWALLALAGMQIAARVESSTALWIILVGAAAMRASLLLEPPYLSTDIYRYVWDGRVQGAGTNPYLFVPAAPELAALRDTAIYPNINRADYAPTIYPPAAQVLFWLITRFGDGVVTMKLGLLACEALAIASLMGILRRLGLPMTAVVAYAWHPMPVWEIAGNGHVDAALLGLTAASLGLFLHGRALPAGFVGSVASFVKPTALLLMPVFWRPWDWRLPALVVVVGAALYAPYLSAGWNVLGYLHGYMVEEGFASGGGFRYLGMLERLTGPIPHGATAYLVAAGAIVAGLALRIGFRGDRSPTMTIAALGALLTVFLVLLTPHYPWYYLILGPFLVLQRTVTPWVLMTGGFLLYDVIDQDWMPPFALREGAFHLSALVAVAYDLWAARSPASAALAGETSI